MYSLGVVAGCCCCVRVSEAHMLNWHWLDLRMYSAVTDRSSPLPHSISYKEV